MGVYGGIIGAILTEGNRSCPVEVTYDLSKPGYRCSERLLFQ